MTANQPPVDPADREEESHAMHAACGSAGSHSSVLALNGALNQRPARGLSPAARRHIAYTLCWRMGTHWQGGKVVVKWKRDEVVALVRR